MSQELARCGMEPQVEPAPLKEWTIEICSRCRIPTEYDRDYGGPFPVTACGRADCPTEKVGNLYATCPAVENIIVVEKPA